jgi:hypothetical protein
VEIDSADTSTWGMPSAAFCHTEVPRGNRSTPKSFAE